MDDIRVMERDAKTDLRVGKDKNSGKTIQLTAEQNERINKAIVRSILEEANASAEEWISFSRA